MGESSSRLPGWAKRLIALDVGLAVLELGYVAGAVLQLSGLREAEGPHAVQWMGLWAAFLILPTLVMPWWALRPVLVGEAAKRHRQSLGSSAVEALLGAFVRLPILSGLWRFGGWTAFALAMAVEGHRRGGLGWVETLGTAAFGIQNGLAAAALRAVVWQRQLGRVRRFVLPNLDALKFFTLAYRRNLVRTGLMLLTMAHAAFAGLAAVATALSRGQAARLEVIVLPALVAPFALWVRSLWKRTRPIEAYLDVAVRRPPVRGPSREDPRAVAAFQGAQGLPYRLAGYAALSALFTGVGVMVLGRRLVGFDTPTAGRLLAVMGLVVVAMSLFGALLLRGILRPLLGQLGARHRLPVEEVRSALSFPAKLVILLLGVAAIVGGAVLLFLVSPERSRWGLGLGGGVSLVLVLALVDLIVRDMVGPIRALGDRAEDMARGELARPVPPAGEADEIGRLTFAFEEMRRALRDRLRSTESLNIDLEREVRRRTEVLEQRNGELREALEKLRRAQDDLIRTEKLASMGRLVAGIAHEINNPVNAVINTLGPLGERVEELRQRALPPTEVKALADDMSEMLAVVQRGAARSKAIVQALHNYSRGDDDMPRDVNVARSVDDALDLLRHRLRHVRIEKAIDPELKVRGFAGQLDQVFMNLITNAAQALGGSSLPGKSEAGLIRVEAEHVGHAVVVRVRDDGPGIPADVLPRIFDPFFTTKDVGEGSGLGLSIVHGIIERHGGKIQVASEPGHGTVFTLTFPVGALPVSGPAAAGRTSVAIPAAAVGAGSAVGAEASRVAPEDGGGSPQVERRS